VLDKYTHPNIVIIKHNGDDKPHDWHIISNWQATAAETYTLYVPCDQMG